MPTDRPATFTYPETRTVDVADDYHGTTVADPYRWLEDPTAPGTEEWIEAQNALTFSVIREGPARDRIKTRLTALWDFPKYGVIRREGDRYYFWKNAGLQNQSVLYTQPDLRSDPVAVLDPNTLSADGTTAVTSEAFTKDGRLLGYGVARSGSDWKEIHVLDVDAGRDLADVIHWCRFTNIAWKHDRSGFFYNRFPEPGSVPPEDESNFQRVYWHALGSPQADDRLVYERPDQKELGFSPAITDDGRYLTLHVWQGTDPRNRFYYREVERDGEIVRLLDDFDARYDFVDNAGTTFYFNTDLDAPRGRVIAVDVADPARERWREIIPESEDTVDHVLMVNDHLVVVYLHHAHHRVALFTLDGRHVRDLPLPGIGSIQGITGRREDKELFFGFTSYLFPTTVFRYDFATGQVETVYQPRLDFDPSSYETRQVFYESKDGTRIPMFLVHKRGLALDGSNPTLLYGYGGFNVSQTPDFRVHRLVWLEQGGVFAVANLRGGGEYGEDWHRQGTLANKQNVFDDFQAAAEWLIDNGYTSSRRLAIMGGSNGGLLVAACLLQRPTLYGAVVCAVPVADMLRYHRFTIGRFWVSDYGNAEADPEHFRFLYRYSPVHNVRPGTQYPPTLITTADTDDRVAPAHAKKLAAALQAAQAGPNPILLRVEARAGHGLGKPTTKLIDELADTYAFLFRMLEVDYRQ